ncbi:sigma-E factor negative regulatory protein [Candidatus Vondammii sp. HM_W22]|uniref:sigma-E factor negative regulatory protein n=1 Tax=Candidatus Vondammii sp. HM_W22 TaxID=2687299 RepID=UPI001F14733C|nr:sigma-E factor negative regulatory protein [Candidatus Vondammii sp. HM_W22]
MTDQINEQLSALQDDELSSNQLNHILNRIKDDLELRRAWGSYHFIGDALRGEAVRISADSVAYNVRERLKFEPAIIATSGRKVCGVGCGWDNRWIRPAAGAVLAASVAVMAVFTFPQFSDMEDGVGLQIAATAPERPYLRQTGTRWKNLAKPEVESRLNRYLVDHNGFASQNGMSGVLPYTSFVSYDPNRW